ncbi:arginine repressor [Clostridia bacterium]|nr:arginine repressor [Clostridia bacterium]GHV32792.1 arginine repressor [Clostridia bacterium]
MKNQRQNALLHIIRENRIETQEELSERLKAMGIEVTQATVSRDIKELRLLKTPSEDGRYFYAVPSEASGQAGHPDRENLNSIFRSSVISANAAQNIVVIKTLPAMANGACFVLDDMPELSIVGTLAGDDTAFILMPDAASAAKLLEKINEMLG